MNGTGIGAVKGEHMKPKTCLVGRLLAGLIFAREMCTKPTTIGALRAIPMKLWRLWPIQRKPVCPRGECRWHGGFCQTRHHRRADIRARERDASLSRPATAPTAAWR